MDTTWAPGEGTALPPHTPSLTSPGESQEGHREAESHRQGSTSLTCPPGWDSGRDSRAGGVWACRDAMAQVVSVLKCREVGTAGEGQRARVPTGRW